MSSKSSRPMKKLFLYVALNRIINVLVMTHVLLLKMENSYVNQQTTMNMVNSKFIKEILYCQI